LCQCWCPRARRSAGINVRITGIAGIASDAGNLIALRGASGCAGGLIALCGAGVAGGSTGRLIALRGTGLTGGGTGLTGGLIAVGGAGLTGGLIAVGGAGTVCPDRKDHRFSWTATAPVRDESYIQIKIVSVMQAHLLPCFQNSERMVPVLTPPQWHGVPVESFPTPCEV
jgi:hypothetical protein